MNIIARSHVWVEDPEAVWIDGQVTAIKGDDATILNSNGKTVRMLLIFSLNDFFYIYKKNTRTVFLPFFSFSFYYFKTECKKKGIC